MTTSSGDGLSSLPSPLARLLAFSAILAAGACGAIIGWNVVKLQVTGDASTAAAVGALIGGVGFAAGVAVVSVLALRAMAEWKATDRVDFDPRPTHPDRRSQRR